MATRLLIPAILLIIAAVLSIVAAQDYEIWEYTTGTPGAGQTVVEIKWNATGIYIRVYPFEQIQLGKFVFNVFYDFSNHSYYSTKTQIDVGDYVYINSTGVYITKGVYTDKTVFELAPHVCAYIEEVKQWICGYESGTTYESNIPSGNYTIQVHVNSCVVLVYTYITYENETPPALRVQLYDFYNQKLLWEGDLSNVTRVIVCGVPDRVLVNVTLLSTNEWLGMYYVSTVMPKAHLPANLQDFGFLLLLGPFLALCVRHKTRLAGLGMMIYGFFLPGIAYAFGLVTTPWGSAAVGIASGLLIVAGLVILLFANKM